MVESWFGKTIRRRVPMDWRQSKSATVTYVIVRSLSLISGYEALFACLSIKTACCQRLGFLSVR